MPRAPVPPEVSRFLDGVNDTVIATLRPDGSPHTTATWYLWEQGRILVNLDDVRPRLGWMRRDGRVAMTMIDPDSFYRHVSIMGKVVEIYDDVDRADIDRLARRYTGKPYPRRKLPRVSVWIEVERWHGWDRAPSEDADPDRPRLPV